MLVNKNKKSELQYNVKYAYGNSYITFYEDGTYSRNVNEIVKSKNYTYDKETKEIVCKEVQVIATLDTECEIHFEFINPNEIKLTSYKILDVEPKNIELGTIYSTKNIENKSDKYYDPFDENGFPKIIRRIENSEKGDNGQGYTFNLTMSEFINKYDNLVKEENKIAKMDLIREENGQRVFNLKINDINTLKVFVSSKNYIVGVEYSTVGRLKNDENSRYVYMTIFNTDEAHTKSQILAEEQTGTSLVYSNGVLIDKITNAYTETVRMTCNYPLIDNAIDVKQLYK